MSNRSFSMEEKNSIDLGDEGAWNNSLSAFADVVRNDKRAPETSNCYISVSPSETCSAIVIFWMH